ncbi:MAG: DUF6752 domain-containing protein [Nocardioidaceae bacterium]
MSTHRETWRSRALRRLGVQPNTPPHDHPQIRRRMNRLTRRQAGTRRRLEARLAELEAELQEQRRLSLRVAELSDLVAELVGAAARGGDAEFQGVLARYSESL